MSVEFGAGRTAGLNSLRAGAALALVLGTGAMMPAHAQSSADTAEAPAADPVAEDDQTQDGRRRLLQTYPLPRLSQCD